MDNQDKASIIAQGIANARKVMEKVEGGLVKPSNNVARGLSESDIDRMLDNDTVNYVTEKKVQQPTMGSNMKNLHKSKMPADILKSFQENPIIDPTAPVGMESMMQEITKKVLPMQEVAQKVAKETQQAPQLDAKLIEFIIKKTVEETLEQVSKRTSIDETIQIKIGDKTFGGKLTVLKENKINENKK